MRCIRRDPQRGGLRLWHAHDLICKTIRLLLVYISSTAERSFRLDSLVYLWFWGEGMHPEDKFNFAVDRVCLLLSNCSSYHSSYFVCLNVWQNIRICLPRNGHARVMNRAFFRMRRKATHRGRGGFRA